MGLTQARGAPIVAAKRGEPRANLTAAGGLAQRAARAPGADGGKAPSREHHATGNIALRAA